MRRGLLEAGDPIWYSPAKHSHYWLLGDVPGLFVRLSARRAVVRLLIHPKQVQLAVDPTRVRTRKMDAPK